MGLILTNKEKEVYIGYIGFGLIRQSIANAYDKKIGILYKKMYNPLFEKYTDKENDYLDKNLPKYLNIFLYHSDCDGYFCVRDVKGIYRELITLKPIFPRNEFNKKYSDLLELFSQSKRIDIY